ncbi:MAG TPA: hypothetical protein VGF25_03195 [Thermoleophilaceae bacterium]|jgi:hypothetical protein
MRDRGLKGLGIAGVAFLAFFAPATAVAAPAKPAVTTGAVSNLAQTTVVLNGNINPNGAATTYFFQYGPTSLYGAQTPAATTGNGTKGLKVSLGVAGLAPATRYHYRLVGRNSKGLVKGKDRVFTTRRQPLGVTLAATPNPIIAGHSATLAGQLTGTGNAGRVVALQANPFPYTQGFLTLGNSQVTGPTGAFSFPLLSVAVNTQYRVLMPANPRIVSPIVVLGAAVRVTTHAKARGSRLRFSGRIRPGAPGSQIVILKRRHGKWVRVGRTFARARSGGYSAYRKVIHRVRGRYRIAAVVEGAYTGNFGRVVVVHRRR